MALRLLPFRQYAEQDVINLYKVNIASSANNAMATPFVNGDNDNGVLVQVDAGNMDGDPVDYVTDSYLGKTDYPFIGRDQYPVVALSVKVADSSEGRPLGVTLRQTLTHDENGEKLLYYPQKAIEMQAVLTGQAVPVLTRGVITVDGDTAFDDGGEPSAVGTQVYQGTVGSDDGAGKFSTTNNDTAGAIGVVIATGNRINRGVSPDYFAGNSVGVGAANTSGSYYVIRLDVK